MPDIIKIRDLEINAFIPDYYGEFETIVQGCRVYFERDCHCSHLNIELPNKSFFCIKDVFENISNTYNTKTSGSYYVNDQLFFSFRFNEMNCHRFYVKEPYLIDSFLISEMIRLQEGEYCECEMEIGQFSNETLDKILLLDPNGLILVSFEDAPVSIFEDYVVYEHKKQFIHVPKLLQNIDESSTKDNPLDVFLKRVSIVKNKKSETIKKLFPNVKYFMMES